MHIICLLLFTKICLFSYCLVVHVLRQQFLFEYDSIHVNMMHISFDRTMYNITECRDVKCAQLLKRYFIVV